MVPYSSATYVEHVFKILNVQGSQKATIEDKDIEILIQAAEKLRDLVKEMENAEEITGFIVYKEESEEDLRKRKEDQEKVKELIK